MIMWDVLTRFDKTVRAGNDCHEGKSLLCPQVTKSSRHICHAGLHGGGGSKGECGQEKKQAKQGKQI